MENVYQLPERTQFTIKAQYYFEEKQDADKAMAILLMWSQIYPNDVNALAQQALFYFIRQDLTNAVKSYEKILEIDPSQVQYLDDIADLYQQLGQHEEAERSLQRYIEIFPTRTDGYENLSDFYSRIGSETKTFTITAVLQLADQRRIGLDDAIGRYLDGVPGGDAITVRQLAGMRSGLANYTETQGFRDAITADPHREYYPAELLGFAFAEPPVFPPGEGLQYSNTNTILLGLLVEKISGMRLGDYLRENVLAPLRLSHTSFPSGAEFPAPHAQGYTELADDGPPITAVLGFPGFCFAGRRPARPRRRCRCG